MPDARVGKWRQEVLCADGAGIDAPSANRRSSERFQGQNGWMSAGGLPPAVAQLSKYQVSHDRGLIFQWAKVANRENIVAASRPLHREPEP